MYTFADAVRDHAKGRAVRLALVLLLAAIVLLISPWPKATTGRTYENNSSVAWSFWSNDPGMTYTRDYVASQHENVAYEGSINAPETADLNSVIPDNDSVAAFYDTDAHQWHVFRLSQD
jgi:hypothetical protein